LIFGIVGAAMKAYKRPATTGAEELIGATAVVVDWQGTRGQVRVRGEIWGARADKPLWRDAVVRIVGREGMTLIVER
jgi:membrane-bound serine protease (ClpP class)